MPKNVQVLMDFGASETMDWVTSNGESIDMLLKARGDGSEEAIASNRKVAEILSAYKRKSSTNNEQEKKWSWKRVFGTNKQ